MMEHSGFILAAYVVTAVVLMGAVAAVLIDGRNLRRTMAQLERRVPEGRRDDAAR